MAGTETRTTARRRWRIAVAGTVQGVGFRPFVYRLAVRYKLSGWVYNTVEGVLIEVEGDEESLHRFLDSIRSEPPPLASISGTEAGAIPVERSDRFVIRESIAGNDVRPIVPPDVATCPDCLHDITSPENRRYGYPFTNCTNCGPRFTIIQGIPYDRPNTTMSSFRMCPECGREYDDPLDRRFHAQPNACPVCGPHLTIDGKSFSDDRQAIVRAADLLRGGKILAIKGLGGFHLACDARNDDAVHALRARKGRIGKPFALMCADIEEVCRICQVDAESERLLLSPERPIVLMRALECGSRASALASLPAPAVMLNLIQHPQRGWMLNQVQHGDDRYDDLERKAEAPSGDSASALQSISPLVAEGTNNFGIMLPYTPLHHLLMSVSPPTLVMTSGNLSEEPIAHEDEDAASRLGHIADHILAHDRPIHVPCDDSVARAFNGAPMVIRRARGYVPRPIDLGVEMPKVLACGGDLKSTFCLTKGSLALLSQHLGDLENVRTLDHYVRMVDHFRRFFDLQPEVVAHDLHPDYRSTRYAESLDGVSRIGVQHHHAHIVSCMAENRIEGPLIGVAFDGTGYGADGRIWGGEFLVAEQDDFTRVAHLAYVPLPGGDAAVRRPGRMALSYLISTFGPGIEAGWLGLTPDEDRAVRMQIERGLNSPLTSSMGRLFDAVSALLGVCTEVTYEGQAAIELEAVASGPVDAVYPFDLSETTQGIIEIDMRPMVRGIAEDIAGGASVGDVAGRFHSTIADMTVGVCAVLRERIGLSRVALSGGVFQNILLLGMATERLKARGFEVFTHSLVPCNDGGLSLGQAVVAARRCIR